VHPQIGLLDHHIGPDAIHQLAPADHVTGALGEGDQDVEGTTSKTDGFAPLEQQPLCDLQPEGPKDTTSPAPGLSSIPRRRCVDSMSPFATKASDV
jgi:hypothetical protein